MQTPLLEIKNITVVKGNGQRVLDSVSITIHPGENVAILGPNGAGKSSLIKIITREYYPFRGDEETYFRIWGEETWNIFDLRYLLGIVTNDLQQECSRSISGYEMVLSGFFSSIGLFHHEITPPMEKKARDVLGFLEIDHLSEKRMNEISSGESRRILIGRALVHEPKALILDEPMNSLDLHARYRFRGTLCRIAKSGTNIILVTHNLADIIPEIGRVILMEGGKVVGDGPKEEMLKKSKLQKLFNIPLELKKKDGYYYILG